MTTWFAASLSFAAPNLAANAHSTEPSPSVLRQIHKLKRLFQAGRRSPNKRAQAIQELLQLGPPGAAALREMVRIDIAPTVSRYVQTVAESAYTAISKQDRDQARRAELRNVFGTLLADPDLSKERIVAEADPAIAELRQLLEPRPEQINFNQEELEKLRRAILESFAIVAAADRVLASQPNRPLEDQDDPSELPQPSVAPSDGTDWEVANRRLHAIETDALTMAIAPTAACQRTLDANAQIAARFDAAEVDAIARINRIRILVGLSAMRIDPKLMLCAQGHSTDMVRHRFFSHTSPVPGKKSFGDRAKLAGTTASRENIYHGSADPEGPIQSWWHSPPHFKNVLSRSTRAGIGRHENHWTFVAGN